MRWFMKIGPENEDRRIIKRFAFFPVKIGLEVRWLEFVKYVQEFNQDYVNSDCGASQCWANKKFLN